jgi:hypothetical protein
VGTHFWFGKVDLGKNNSSPLNCKLNRKLIPALCTGVKMHPLPYQEPLTSSCGTAKQSFEAAVLWMRSITMLFKNDTSTTEVIRSQMRLKLMNC